MLNNEVKLPVKVNERLIGVKGVQRRQQKTMILVEKAKEWGRSVLACEFKKVESWDFLHETFPSWSKQELLILKQIIEELL